MGDTPTSAFTARWHVVTMTHDDDMFDADGQPVDDGDHMDWAVAYDVVWGSDEWHAVRGVFVADRMTFGVAAYIAGLHNDHYR